MIDGSLMCMCVRLLPFAPTHITLHITLSLSFSRSHSSSYSPSCTRLSLNRAAQTHPSHCAAKRTLVAVVNKREPAINDVLFFLSFSLFYFIYHQHALCCRCNVVRAALHSPYYELEFLGKTLPQTHKTNTKFRIFKSRLFLLFIVLKEYKKNIIISKKKRNNPNSWFFYCLHSPPAPKSCLRLMHDCCHLFSVSLHLDISFFFKRLMKKTMSQ